MDYRLLMDTAILAGEIIMESGGEAYRAEETVARMLNISHSKHVEVVVQGTSIVATVSNPYRDAITVTRRVRRKGTNLNRISCVNDISRELCAEQITLEEAFHQLKELNSKTLYPEFVRFIATMVAAMGFTYTFGGRGLDLAYALVCGAAVYLVRFFNYSIKTASFITEMLASFTISAVAIILFHIHPAGNMDVVIIGSLMLLVPGLAITNSARDILVGDYVSGSARVVEAIVISLSIALGTGLVLILGNLIG